MSANEHNAAFNPHPEDFIVPENLEGIVGESVQEIEDELTPLQLLIENGDWEGSMNRVLTHPHEIMPTQSGNGSGRGLTALHLACESGDCPHLLLRAMLARRPRAVGMIDRDGNTPLHNACASRFAYDPVALCLLLIAYPQATLMQDFIERSTPLHLLLVLGGEVNRRCLRLLLDVAYSAVAGLPLSYVPQEDYCVIDDLINNLLTAANYPPIVIQIIREVAIEDPFSFPKYLYPFIQLPAPNTLDVSPQLLENQKQLLLIQQCNQQTPLHTACARGLGPEVFELLTSESRYPGAHQAARIKDQKDRHPLFYAACYGVNLDTVKVLYDLYPDAVHHYESYNILPLHVAYITPAYSNTDREFELIRSREDNSLSLEQCFKHPTAIPMWHTYEFFLRLTYHGTYQDPPPGCAEWRILHALGCIPSPHHFVRSAVQLYPWQLKQYDENGYLPLQLAAMCKRPRGIDKNQYWLPEGINKRALYVRCLQEDRSRDNTLSIFVDGYRAAASILDQHQKLPLHWGIESGKQWNEGIKSLVDAAPLALTTRDGQRKLYPFMIAATIGNVSLTFNLLLSNPMVVRSGIIQQTASACPIPVAKKPKL
jgi:ankyrin repeat protein